MVGLRILIENGIIFGTLQYSELKVKMGDPALKTGCDGLCQEQNLCDMVTTAWASSSRCTELLEVRKSSN